MLIDNLVTFFKTVGIVAWPLLVFSLLGLALIIERLYFWVRLNRRQSKVMRDVLQVYFSDPYLAIKRLKQNANLPICRIFLEALELDRPTPEEFRLALESASQAELPLLKRSSTLFETIITAAPLLGLLGTVLGLITTFSALKIGSAVGEQGAKVTAGIAEALASTAAGLVVALFTLLFANLFRGFYQSQIAFIQEYSGQLELLYRRQYEQRKPEESLYAPT